MPARTGGGEFSSLVEKYPYPDFNFTYLFSFENEEKYWRLQISHGAAVGRKRGAHRGLFRFWAPIKVTLFLSLVCIILASQRALLVVYLVSLVYVRVPNAWVGGGGCRACPSFLKFAVTRWNICSRPAYHPDYKPLPRDQLGVGEGKYILFEQLFKKKKKAREEAASLIADSLFNRLHKIVQKKENK